MRPRWLWPALAVGTILLAGCASTPAVPAFDPADGRVTITWQAPEKFTDARESYQAETEPRLLTQLEDTLQHEIRRYLPAGEKFSITFTDVDRAGDFEPVPGGPKLLRIVKSIYPPRFVFGYVRTAADGKVLAQGKEELTDLNFYLPSSFNPQGDPLFYEKNLLKKWVASTFQR